MAGMRVVGRDLAAPRVALAVLLWGLSACTGPGAPSLQFGGVPPSAPELAPGDRWVYEWASGTEKGTKTVEILGIQELNRVRYYLVRVGDVDHYYTMDLHWAGGARDGTVETRMIPPQPWFVWPLEVGRRWTHRGVFEGPGSRQERQDAFSVIGAERVEVPAGRFAAFKLVREGDHRDSDQYWYVPEVRWYARWIGRRGDVQFEERLREYQLAPRPVPAPSPGSPPRTP